MKRIFLASLTGIVLASCTKVQDPASNPNQPNASSLSDLVIPDEFNWSSSTKGRVVITLVPDTAVFATDGQELQLVDENDEILDRKMVQGSTAEFYMIMPQVDAKLYAFLPSTGDKMEITKAGNMTMNIQTNFLNADFATLLANAQNGSGKKSRNAGKVQGTELLANGDFETNSFVAFPNNTSNLNEDQWYVSSSSNKWQWHNANGGKVFRSKHNTYGYAYQLTSVNGGDLYTTTATTSGDFCTYIFYYDANGSYISYDGYAPNVGNNIDYSGTIPNNASYALIKVHGPKNDWIDDVTFEVDAPISDADNDGVADNDDDYPNDPTRAYTSTFPTSGYQTIAFEDLWPQKGDYDFNDMVLSNQIVYTSNANNELVDGSFSISLDAVGSGFANGLAIVFVDDNNNPISQDIISSVSGDAIEDPSVTNGIIVFDHVYNSQSEYYQNNGEGPTKTPDVFTFTVNFNANASAQNIIPDVYIFRSNDRGLEIHLDGFSGTTAANANYYNTGFDVNGTYSTASGLPWALEVVTPNKSFEHPKEKIDILNAYPEFQVWAESNGTLNQSWRNNPVTSQIFDAL